MGAIASLIVDVAANTVKLQQDAERINKTLDSITGMAKKVAGALGIAFSADALISFVAGLFTAADQLTKLSDKTGIGTEALQRLAAVGEESGNSIDQLASAIVQMQNRLAGGDKSAVAALQAMHLSLAEIRDLSPDEQFSTIASAIAKIPDPMTRTNVAMAIFGKAGAEILPSILADIDKITASTRVMSDATVKKLDEAGDAWGRLWRIIKVGGAEATVFLMKAAEYMLQLRGAHIDVSAPNAPGGPGGLTAPPLGMPSIDTEAEEQKLKAALDKRLTLLKKNAVDEAALIESNSQLYHDAILNEIVLLDQLRIHNIQAQVDPLREAQAMLKAGIGVKDLGQGLGMQGLATPPPSLAANSDSFLGGIAKNFSWGSFKANFQSGMSTAIGNSISGVVGMAAQHGGILGDIGKGAQMGMMFGPWGAAIGAGIGAAVNGIGKLMKNEEKKVNDMRDNFQKMTFGSLAAMDDAFHKVGLTVDKVLNAKKVKDFDAAVAEFNKRLEFQKQSFERLQQAIDRYGFSVEELGPAMARQKLDEQAIQIYEDWMLLIGAGLDVEVVTKKMAAAVNQMLKSYLTMGLEVPPALRPILQQMIDMGLLLDQNGDLITDITKIPFAETMTEGFNRVVEAINRMVDSIQLFLGITTAAADIVRNFPDLPNTQTPGTPPNDTGPDIPQPPDSQAFNRPVVVHTRIDARGAFFDTSGSQDRLARRVSDATMQKVRQVVRLNVVP